MTRTWLRLSPLRYFGVALQSLLLNILFHRCESSSVEKGSYLRLKGQCFSQNFTCGGQRQVYGLCCHSCPTLQLLLFKSLIRPSHSRVRKVVWSALGSNLKKMMRKTTILQSVDPTLIGPGPNWKFSPEAEFGLPEFLAAKGEPPLELLLADAALLVVLLRYHHQRVDQLLGRVSVVSFIGL